MKSLCWVKQTKCYLPDILSELFNDPPQSILGIIGHSICFIQYDELVTPEKIYWNLMRFNSTRGHLLKMVLVEAKLRIWPLTIPMPLSSLAFSSRTWWEQLESGSKSSVSYHGIELLWGVDLLSTCQDGACLPWQLALTRTWYRIAEESGNMQCIIPVPGGP